MMQSIIRKNLPLLDILVSAAFGAYIGYTVQLSADSGDSFPDKLTGSLLVGLCSFLGASVVALLVSFKFKSIPSWLLLAFLAPFLFIIGLMLWRYELAAAGPALGLALIVFIPFFLALILSRIPVILLLELTAKYWSSHPKVSEIDHHM